MRTTKISRVSSPLLTEIIDSMFQLSRAMRHAMECNMKDQSINMLQFHAMLFLREHKGLTMSELARQMHVTSPTATSFINRLVRQKWVSRHSDPKNRKLVRLHLTGSGMTSLQKKMTEHRKIISGVFGLLSSSEQRQLLVIHKKLLSRLAEDSLS